MLDAPISTRRSPLIDSVRAVLAIWVVLTHLIRWAPIAQGPGAISGFSSWLMQELIWIFQPNNETHPAVLCFIVLSGYCIHRNGLRRTRSDVAGYSIRRVLRIYPVYLVATTFGIACFLIATHAASSLGQELSGTAKLSWGCLLAKLSLVNSVDPNLLYCVYQGNGPLNTVMVEMCLYALYPALLLLVARRFGERMLVGPVILTWIGGIMFISINPAQAYWWSHASVAGFLVYWWIGAKFLDPRFAAQVSRHWYWVLAGWVVLSAAILGHIVDGVIFSEFRKIAQTLMFGMFVVWIDSLRITLPWFADRLGKAGYSIYAYHAPLVYTLLILNVPWWLVLAAAIAAGAIGYAVIERPFMSLGRRLAARPVPSQVVNAIVSSETPA
jgi:peptidoglycan/LPS O-acetylase OafA/YrhL